MREEASRLEAGCVSGRQRRRFCRKVRFLGKIQKSGVRNSITYRLSNSRKSNFATELFSETHTGLHSRVSGSDRLRSLLEVVVPAGEDVVADPRQIDAHRQPLCPLQSL